MLSERSGPGDVAWVASEIATGPCSLLLAWLRPDYVRSGEIMPELPEVESARAVIERTGLGRAIVGVNDSDTYVCRPHRPGQIRDALLGRALVAAHRRGKSMWCDTSDGGPELGMSGKIVIADPDGTEIALLAAP